MSGNKAVISNSDTSFLKIIAIASMMIDHLGVAIFPGQAWMRIVGRLAFPLFAYCVAVGSAYTHSMPKYILRVLAIGIISQPIYVLALNHITPLMKSIDITNLTASSAAIWYIDSLNYSNIMFALALGLMVIWSLQEEKYIVTGLLVIASYYLNPYLSMSYGWKGIALMVIFYQLLDRPMTSFIWAGGFMCWWGFYQSSGFSLMSPNLTTQSWALMALPLIYMPTNTGIKLNKWVFYLFYPGHLLLLYIMERYLI